MTGHTVDCEIVVVTYNSERHILPLLQSIEAAAGRCSWRATVVDNASSDDTAERVARFPRATFVSAGANVGYAAAINLGRRVIGAHRSLLIANPDVRLGPLCIERLLDALTSGAHGAAVPRLTGTDGQLSRSLRREPTIGRQLGESVIGDRLPGRPAFFSEIVRDPIAYATPHNVDWATGAVVLVSAECDEAVGEWDESYFLFSEEVDYAARIRATGRSIAYVPDAVAEHEEGGSGRPSPLLGLLVVNRLRYYRRRHGRVRAALFCVALVLGLVIRFPDRNHRLAAKALFGAMVTGVACNRFPAGERLVT